MKKTLLALVLGSVVAAAGGANFEVNNSHEFNIIVHAKARLEKLGSGMRFVEGPVWVDQDGGYLVFSDIPANELKKYVPGKEVKTFRNPSQNANGNTYHRGKLYTAEHSGRRISVTDEKGNVQTVVDSFEGKKLNSPNDVVIHRDGTLWFTDPDYGIQPNQKEQKLNNVYRYDPDIKEIRSVVISEPFEKPNGLCFSPDGKKLYVADSGKPAHIRVFNVDRKGRLDEGKVFAKIDKGAPDGIRCDLKGRVYSSAGDGVHIFDPDGRIIGKIFVPEAPANLCFGGKDMKTLYITARTSLYSIALTTKGKQ